jgi:hypothetical protein
MRVISQGKRFRSSHLGSVGNGLKLAVPVIFALNERAAVKLATLKLHGYDMALRLVQQLNWDSQTLTHCASFLFVSVLMFFLFFFSKTLLSKL